MSVKIYYGFKTTLTLNELLSRVRTFRATVWRPDAEKQIDTYMKNFGKGGYVSWLDGRAEARRTKISNPLLETDCSITVFPVRDIYEDRDVFVGIVYAAQRQWYTKWLQQPDIQEYGYWDNSDEPEGIPADLWETRRLEWGKALLNHSGVPSMEGFSIDISDPLGPAPKAWRP
jgi:hypothetical protein